VWVILGIVFLIGLMIATADPFGLAHGFFLLGLYAVVLIFLGYAFFTSRSRSHITLAICVAIILTFVVYLSTSQQGAPYSPKTNSTSCGFTGSVTFTITISPVQFTNTTYLGSRCTTTTNYNSSAILIDFLYWFFVSSLIIYSMPAWEGMSSAFCDKVARNLIGSALGGALLFLVVGLASGSGYLTNTHYLVPFNPYIAYADCGSMEFETGRCVTVSTAYYLTDYAFWFALASLVALTASELLNSLKTHRET